jgi:hypothetical protein
MPTTFAVPLAAVGRQRPSPKSGNRPQNHRHTHEETGAARYLVQVIFHDIAPGTTADRRLRVRCGFES